MNVPRTSGAVTPASLQVDVVQAPNCEALPGSNRVAGLAAMVSWIFCVYFFGGGVAVGYLTSRTIVNLT